MLDPQVLLLQLAAMAAVLAVGDVIFQGLHAWANPHAWAGAMEDEDGSFTLHFGWFFLVVVTGTVLAIWWGWLSTGIVLLVDGVLLGVTGLASRLRSQ